MFSPFRRRDRTSCCCFKPGPYVLRRHIYTKHRTVQQQLPVVSSFAITFKPHRNPPQIAPFEPLWLLFWAKSHIPTCWFLLKAFYLRFSVQNLVVLRPKLLVLGIGFEDFGLIGKTHLWFYWFGSDSVQQIWLLRGFVALVSELFWVIYFGLKSSWIFG